MVVDADRFSAQVIAVVAKRAGNACSNPDCGALTIGPAEEPSRAVSMGAAAHIFGAHAGSARFKPEMMPTERSDATNAIWLCSNCHRLVDADPDHYPAGLLFEWKKAHERDVSERLGKLGDLARRRYLDRHLTEFSGLSYLAEQIIGEKPDHWEYKLTAEVLRVKTGPIEKRWGFLKRGLYFKPILWVPADEALDWFQLRNHEIGLIVPALAALLNEEFQRAWGEPGVPGSDVDIVEVCQLFGDVCAEALAWEERVRFAKLPTAYEPVQEIMMGVAGRQLEEVCKMPAELSAIFDIPNPSGNHHLSIKFDLPDGWADELSERLRGAVEETMGIDLD